ncbi:MAG: hypothetical protein JWN52_4761 [Actinomycetia bacterium]|nr:hypothetical protein [Actinomycetes bacterium]
MIEIDGPFYRITADGFELTIPRWEGHSPDDTEEADVTITLPDGSRHYATFMTLGAIKHVMERHREVGECHGGGYFWASDLIILSEPGFPAVIDAVAALIASGDLATACGALQ